MLPRDLLPELDDLVPAPYEAYGPLVRDMLAEFWSRLGPARCAEVIQALSSPAEPDAAPIPAGTPLAASQAARALVAVLRLSPTLHKLGQVVARDRRLVPELRRRLQELESLPGATPIAALEPALDEARRAVDGELRLGPRPLAEGSVAVVVPGVLTGEHEQRVVAKVLRPGVEERLEQELAVLAEVGETVEQACRERGLRAPDYRETFEQVRDLLRGELDLAGEQENLRRARASLAGSGTLVPHLLDGSTARVTLMTRIEGRLLSAAVAGPDPLNPKQKGSLSSQIVRALVARPLLCPEGTVIFHGDPHAGNLMFDDHGRLAILDWSQAGELSKAERIEMTQVFVGAITFDGGRIVRALATLATRVDDRRKLRELVDRAVGRIVRGTLPGMPWLITLLDDVVLSGAIRFPTNLLLFRKALLTLDGVLADLGGPSFDRTLAVATLGQAIEDWPRRLLALPWSHRFGTHLSNADLVSLFLSGPRTTARLLGRALGRATG